LEIPGELHAFGLQQVKNFSHEGFRSNTGLAEKAEYFGGVPGWELRHAAGVVTP
jgi:hypothetical protein